MYHKIIEKGQLTVTIKYNNGSYVIIQSKHGTVACLLYPAIEL